MSQMIHAVYEDGVLKPLEQLALGEHQQVQIIVEPEVAAATCETRAATRRNGQAW